MQKVMIDGMSVNGRPPDRNIHIWGNVLAVPRLRVLFRQGHDNRYVLNYMLSRYGFASGMDVRDLQFQISHHKRYSDTKEKIWKTLLLIRSGRLASDCIYRHKPQASSCDRRIREAVKSGRRLPIDTVKNSSEGKPPEGYALKFVFSDKGTYQAWCPPYEVLIAAQERVYLDV